MIHTFAGTVNEVYPALVNTILKEGSRVEVRGTSTLELDPIVLEVYSPRHRLVSSYGRPLNVAFALAEVLWILGGRRDVAMLAWYNSTMRKWSDDGLNFNAAYGYRLKHAHGYNQLDDLIMTLADDRSSRRGVMTIWHPDDRSWFTSGGTKIPIKNITLDRACNVLSQAWIRNDRLNWMQVVRSNDAVLGIPYNLFQWTCIQEYVANRLGVEPGVFRYSSHIPHIYQDTYYDEAPQVRPYDIYKGGLVPRRLYGDPAMLSQLAVAEEGLRLRGSSDITPDQFDGSIWWDAYLIWEAHYWYRAKMNLRALEPLLECGGALATTQIKFYWKHRWSKMDKAERQRIAGRIVDWTGCTPGVDEEIHWLLEDD